MSASASDAHPYCIFGARFRLTTPLLDNDGDLITAGAGLDTELTLDSGNIADATNEATEVGGTTAALYFLDLIASETTGMNVSGKIKTSTMDAKPTPFSIPIVRLPVIRTGTAQAGGASSITLDSGASAIDDFYNGCYVNITNNSPSNALGQARLVTAYNGSTKVATVEGTYGTNPSSASTFEVLASERWIYRMSDVRAFGGVASTQSAGRPEVNATHLAGTSQTGRDIGASVLLSPGTGAGQLDITSGVVKGNWVQILGTAITGTAAQLAAAITKFFNVATPTGTVNSLPDAVAGATGGVAIVGSQMALTTAAQNAVVAAIETELANDATGGAFMQAIADKLTAVFDIENLTLAAIGNAARDAILNRVLAGNHDTAGTPGKLLQTLPSSGTVSTLTQAQVNTEADQALADYDGPTNAEMVARTLAAADYATATAAAAIKTVVDAVKLKTDNLPSDPADQSLIIAAADALATLIADLPTNAELANALGTADDAVLAQVALVKAVTDKVDDTLVDSGGGAYIFTAPALANAPSGGVGGFTEDDRDVLETIASTVTSGSGTGAFAITVTVTDGTDPLQGATVRVLEGVTPHTATTDASGNASFSLDAATYQVTASKDGYSFTPTTRTVTGEEAGTLTDDLEMEAVTVPAAEDIAQTTAYLTTYNGAGALQPYAPIDFQLVNPPGAGSYSDAPFRRWSDKVTAELQTPLRKATEYKARRGDNGDWVTFATGSASTYALPQILGHP